MTARLHGSPPSDYRGFCRRCEGEHHLRNDSHAARQGLEQLFEQLESDPSLSSLRAALTASPGKMLGVLVYEGGVLRAYSGDLAGQEWPGWVAPVRRKSDTAELEAITLARIAELDQEIGGCDVAAAQSAYDSARGKARQDAAREHLLAVRGRLANLRRERREASQRLSDAMFEATTVTNAHGKRSSLREVFVGDRIAGGTTDCCVPKLLEAANVARIRPLGLAEAWWGPTLNGRHHGELQPPCERKCLPVLGHLLCGLDDVSASASRAPAAAR